MVTNINLVAPESEKKSVLTGKTALLTSIVFLILTIGAYGVLSYIGNSYSKQKKQIESEIAAGRAKISGTAYTSLADFQERLALLGQVADEHVFMDLFLKNFSRYIIPEVVLKEIAFGSSGNDLSIRGSATSFETLAREMILLKSFPGADSVQFKSGSEKTEVTTGQNGVSFEINLKLNNTALKNK